MCFLVVLLIKTNQSLLLPFVYIAEDLQRRHKTLQVQDQALVLARRQYFRFETITETTLSPILNPFVCVYTYHPIGGFKGVHKFASSWTSSFENALQARS